MPDTPSYNLLAVIQSGRLHYEALLLAASLAETNPDLLPSLHLAEPQPGRRWSADPTVTDDAVLGLLTDLGVRFLTFEFKHFGENYPYGNKIEALAELSPEPFVFFDTDTLFLGPLSQVPFDFDRTMASMKREGTWPQIELYGPGHTEIWQSRYDNFSLEFQGSLDLSQPYEYWRPSFYFNAGWQFHRKPQAFGKCFLNTALAIRDCPPESPAGQTLDPWLDQITLPLVIHSFGGGRDTLPPGLFDGTVTCHYRALPLLHAKESDEAIEIRNKIQRMKEYRRTLREYHPVKKCVYQNRGRKARETFDRDAVLRREQMIRNRLKRGGLCAR